MRRILCIGISFLTLCAAACSSYWDTAIKNTYAYLGRSIPIPAFHAAIPFDEIAFQMPDTERLTEEIARLKERVNSGEAAKGLQSELESLYAELSAMETMAQYAYVRHCLDTKNPVWGERSDRLNAKIDMLYASLNAIALQLSERKELKNDYSPQVVERLKVAASLYAPEVAPLMEQERTLMDEYDRMQTDFSVTVNGVAWTENALIQDAALPFSEWYAIYRVYTEEFSKCASELFLKLVAIRKEIAAQLGYPDYCAYRYAAYGRDYTPREADAFSKAVLNDAVPIYRTVRSDAAVDREVLLLSDRYSEEQVFAPVGAVLKLIDPAFSEPWEYMLTYRYYDDTLRPDKLPGNYTTYFASYGAPFLYLNWDESCEMPTTLLHEFGHYAGYYFRSEQDAAGGTLDLAEVDSQGLELLAIPYYDQLFGNRADEARSVQLSNALYAVISGCVMDAFERFAYTAEDLTAERLGAEFDSLVKSYGLEADGFTAWTWTRIPHLFRSPGYYLSYAVSAVVALELYAISLQNHNRAVSVYRKIINRKDFVFHSVLRESGLTDPFRNDTIKHILKEVFPSYITEDSYDEKSDCISSGVFADSFGCTERIGRRFCGPAIYDSGRSTERLSA